MSSWLRRATGNENGSLAAKADGRRLKACRSINCTNTFPAKGNRNYCSSKCYQKNRYAVKPKSVKCTECKKDFKPLRINAKRCSDVCRRVYTARFSKEYNAERRGASKLVPIKCKNCETVWTPKHISAMFCSIKCKNTYKRLFKYWEVFRTREELWNKTYSREIKQADIRSSEFAEDIKKFKQSGGKVTVLPGEVAPPSLDVYVLGEDDNNAEEEYVDHYRNTPVVGEK
tara:strand:- start:695 stop:1381 length:687 start_codon:yes stop_codon:yes gene_type:complete